MIFILQNKLLEGKLCASIIHGGLAALGASEILHSQ